MTWRILIANLTLGGHTGTEVVTRDFALGLSARGHRVSVFARTLGRLADELRIAGVPVVSRLDDLRDPPDLVHGHHYLETVEALTRFPDAHGLFVCHDRHAPHSIPPLWDRIQHFVAVDHNCLERLRDDFQIPASRAHVILNAVDLERFAPRGPLPAAPARALVFSHYASNATHLDVVRDACRQVGLPVDVLGSAAGAASPTPEAQLGHYDMVFAKGRCALEAMAVGAAVVLCDTTGMGSMVTLPEVRRLRDWNFGARVLRDRLDSQTLVKEIRRYDPADAAAVSRVIREDAALPRALEQYERLYGDAMAQRFEPVQFDKGAVRLVAPLLQRVGQLEADLAGYTRPERMLALSDDAIRALNMSLESALDQLAPGAPAWVRVRLQNRLTDTALGSWVPFPLHWGYRWRAADAPGFTQVETERTPLRQPVAPGCAEIFAVRVIAPAEAGRHVLRLTLVQDGIRWLDQAATPIFVETTVVIRANEAAGA